MFGQWMELVPAYGRDYSRAADVRADWNAGKDFQDTLSGFFVTKDEVTELGLKVTIRYAKHMKILVL